MQTTFASVTVVVFCHLIKQILIWFWFDNTHREEIINIPSWVLFSLEVPAFRPESVGRRRSSSACPLSCWPSTNRASQESGPTYTKTQHVTNTTLRRPRSLCSGWSGIWTCDHPNARHQTYHRATMSHAVIIIYLSLYWPKWDCRMITDYKFSIKGVKFNKRHRLAIRRTSQPYGGRSTGVEPSSSAFYTSVLSTTLCSHIVIIYHR